MHSKTLMVVLAFLAIYIIWGSTYLCIAFVVDEIPPFYVAGIRFIAASVIIFLIYYLFRPKRTVDRVQVRNAVIAGILFLTLGAGGVAWALQFVDSGFTALLISSQPLILILMMWISDKKPLPVQSFFGVFLGMLGIYLLVSQDVLLQGKTQLYGILAIFFCLLAWGYASIFVSKARLPDSPFFSSGIQMLSGGAGLLIISFFWEDVHVAWTSLKAVTWISLTFLVIFGSVIAFSSFNYLLKTVSPEKVSTNTYVNPIVALILGYYYRDELITWQSVIASIVLLTGVYFINSRNGRKSKVKWKVPRFLRI